MNKDFIKSIVFFLFLFVFNASLLAQIDPVTSPDKRLSLQVNTEDQISWAELVLGATYSTVTADFERPIDFPDPGLETPENDDPARVTFNRWRFILGLEIPIFGHKVEFK